MLAAPAVIVVMVGLGGLSVRGQQPKAPSTDFTFQVVQSFNARYLGDSPGHLGRGSLEGRTPDISLGDPVYRGERKVGTVTGLTWDRNKENLEVEVDPDLIELDGHGRPVGRVRIRIGEDLRIPLHTAKTSERGASQ
jgi:hypothetical protein